MHIEIYKRRHLFGTRYYFRIVAANNRTVAQSEGYHNKQDAINTAVNICRSLKAYTPIVEV